MRHSVIVTEDFEEQLHLERLSLVLEVLAGSSEPTNVQGLTESLGIRDDMVQMLVRDLEDRELVSLSGSEVRVTAQGREFLETAKRRYAGPITNRVPDTVRGVPITLIGYWEGPSEPGWPRVEDFVDHNWAQMERDMVASYLEDGFVRWLQCGISFCRFCGAPNGSTERSDGVFVWPDGLAHYIREHGVRLPVTVIRHIVDRSREIHPERVDSTWWRSAILDS
jgi:hypothetical protein